MASKIALRVAGKWLNSFQLRTPSWVYEKYATKIAYSLTPEEIIILKLAKESVSVTLPQFLAVLKKKLSDRYSMVSSTRGADVFCYFSSPHPVDSIALHYTVRGGKVLMDLSYTPLKVNGTPDFSRTTELKKVFEDPEVAGLYLIRLGKELLQKALG